MPPSGIMALRICGNANGDEVIGLASQVMDFGPESDPSFIHPINVTNIREDSTLRLVAESGLIVVRKVLKAQLISSQDYKSGSPVTASQQASLKVSAAVELAELGMHDPNTEVAIRYNRNRDGGYYTLLANCAFRNV